LTECYDRATASGEQTVRLEITIPDGSLTPLRRSKFTRLAQRLESQPELIDTILSVEMTEIPQSKRKSKQVPPLTEDEMKQFDQYYPVHGLLGDVTDEQWQRIEKGTRQMRKKGLPDRA
jgi:hypothetical protein